MKTHSDDKNKQKMPPFLKSLQYGFNPGILCVLLCYLPIFVQFSDLVPFASTSKNWILKVPAYLVWLARGLLVSLLPLPLVEVYRRKKSDLEDISKNRSLVTGGPFKILRHPEYLGEMFFLVLLTLAVIPVFPFTPVTLACDLLVIIGFNILARKEEQVNLAKWGDAYERYMKQVPRFNILKGLWRLAIPASGDR